MKSSPIARTAVENNNKNRANIIFVLFIVTTPILLLLWNEYLYIKVSEKYCREEKTSGLDDVCLCIQLPIENL